MIETGIGFTSPLFFVGVVENNIDNRLEGRVQVRAFGIHGSIDQIATSDLPWATLIIGNHDVNFVVPPLNSWVFGMFLDGRTAQQPFILGLIPTQFTTVNDPRQSGWGVAIGNEVDVNAQGSRAQDFGQPTLSRLARGEELENTYLLGLESNRKRDIPIAGGGASIGSTGNIGAASQDQAGSALVSSPSDIESVITAGPGYNVVKLVDGSTVRRTGARNWRNNNPGNLEYGAFTRSHGAVGSDGRFAIFPSYAAGRTAKESLLFDSSGYAGMTISQAIARYAPPSENNTSNYINTVAAAAGATPSALMSSLSPAQRSALLDSMQQVEGYTVGTVTDATGNEPIMVSVDQTDNQVSTYGTNSSLNQIVWEEPASGYNAVYPYNRVIETGSGHIVELDDTPGAERVMIYHRNGSYIQMTPTTTSIKNVGDNYQVNDKNSHVYVGGANIITIEGDSHVLIKGNKVEEIMGNYTQIVHGNHEVGVGGQANINSSDQFQLRGANLILESNVENLNIKTGKSIRFESGESIHFKSSKVFLEGTDALNIKSDNLFATSSILNIKSDTSNIESGGSINVKGATVSIGGGNVTNINSAVVNIDTIVSISNGSASSPSSAEQAESAESAKGVERSSPPSKKVTRPPVAI